AALPHRADLGRDTDVLPSDSAQRVNAHSVQHVDETYQRQSDERRRIIALDSREERDAERLDLHATGAIEGRFAREIRTDVLGRELAKGAAYVDERRLTFATLRIEQRKPGMEHHASARQAQQQL